MASEDLYDLRNALTLGNYTQVISEAPGIKASPYGNSPADSKALESGRDFLMCKAQIALKRYSSAISDLESSRDTPHRALILLAQYLKADPSNAGDATRERVVEDTKALVDTTLSEAQEATAGSALMATTAATVLVHAGDLKTAHKWLKTWAVSLQKQAETASSNQTLLNELNVLRLELSSHIVDLLLRLNRVDLAEQELKTMNKIDEDAALTLLWTGYVRITPDGAKEALKLFNELRDKFGSTPLLLNAIALAHTALGEHEQASRALDEAGSTNDPDTMINQMVSLRQTRRGQDNKAMLDILKTQFPNHPWVWKYKSLEESFTDAAHLVGSMI
eukprot:TRINITY_DN7685_c0_g1_i1.p1 TRINITY_DN7685_c0_g1~~TRINITY_DN7685_c0_g1_i1.p1  ORF type:complete len:352 (+),score=113.89 TRINITY_DN7685_c0_g1_i1:56-1057(+)